MILISGFPLRSSIVPTMPMFFPCSFVIWSAVIPESAAPKPANDWLEYSRPKLNLLVCPNWNQPKQQTDKHKKWAHVSNQHSLEYGQVCSTQEHFVVPLRSSEFFSIFMSGDKFVFPSRKHCGCVSFSFGLKKVVRESQWVG